MAIDLQTISANMAGPMSRVGYRVLVHHDSVEISAPGDALASWWRITRTGYQSFRVENALRNHFMPGCAPEHGEWLAVAYRQDAQGAWAKLLLLMQAFDRARVADLRIAA